MSEPIKDSVEYIANKFAENPGHFAATILKMYWDMEKERDQYKAECDKLKVENKKLKIKNEYLLNVIKMSEHIQMHTDLEEN